MISVYVDSAPGTFDQSVEKKWSATLSNRHSLLFTVWPINGSKEILIHSRETHPCLCECEHVCASEAEFDNYECAWENETETAGVLYHLSSQLQVKHEFVPCVMNSMQILTQFAVTLSDWNEICC